MLLELRHADPGVARLDQLRLHALDADNLALEGDLEGLLVAFPDNGEADGGLGLAAHAFYRIIEAHAFHRRVVDLDDGGAGLQAGAERRRILDRGDDLDEAVFHADLDPQATKFALGADLKLAERIGVQIGRMRVKVGEHAVDRAADELLVLHRLDVARLDGSEHLGKSAQLVHRERKARDLALRDRREIQAQHDPGDHADEYQADLFQFVAHRHSPTTPADLRAYFSETHFRGSKGLP